jgi:hypothetical protein
MPQSIAIKSPMAGISYRQKHDRGLPGNRADIALSPTSMVTSRRHSHHRRTATSPPDTCEKALTNCFSLIIRS